MYKMICRWLIRYLSQFRSTNTCALTCIFLLFFNIMFLKRYCYWQMMVSAIIEVRRTFEQSRCWFCLHCEWGVVQYLMPLSISPYTYLFVRNLCRSLGGGGDGAAIQCRVCSKSSQNWYTSIVDMAFQQRSTPARITPEWRACLADPGRNENLAAVAIVTVCGVSCRYNRRHCLLC